MGAQLREIFKNSYTRLLVFIFIGLAALALYFIGMIYLIKIQDAKDAEIARLQGICQTVSSLIKATELENTFKKYPSKNEIKTCTQDSIYLKYHLLLRTIQEKNKLSSPIYTLVFNPEKKNFFFVFTSDSNTYYRHEYNTAPDELIKNYKNGGTLEPYRDEHGMWMSAFAPIQNDRGETVAILQVDERFDKFIMEARKNALMHLIFSSLVFIIIGLILYRKVSIFLKEEEEKQISLHYKNHQITSSIQYAKRIQDALLPTEETIQEKLNSFVFYQPKDIVSGDFYWFSDKAAPHLFLAAVDCTGHGVPGAFMSMIGNTILNKLINEKLLVDVSDVLNNMEFELRKALNRSDEYKATTDGMDIALLNICMKTNVITFAGAQRPLILIRNGELKEIKGTKRSIGHAYTEKFVYKKEEFLAEKGDCLYMFSDGYPDQFGGEKGRKFMKKQLKEILLEIHQKPMEEQKEYLKNRFNEWKGKESQIDDILLIGIKI